MKTRFLNFAALVAVFSVSAQAAAAETNWYVAADVGQHEPSELTGYSIGADVDVGFEGDWVGFARAGRRFGEHWRVEAEFAQRPGNYSGTYVTFDHGELIDAERRGKLDARSLMGNILYDVMPDRSISPFVGIGVGGVRFEQDYREDDAFAWQGLAGVSWSITERLSADFTYRYFASELGDGGELVPGQTHEDQAFSVGARYAF